MSKWREQMEAETKPTKGKGKAQAQQPENDPTLEEFEQEMADSMDQLHQAFRDRAAKEQQRVLDVCDSNYYFVVCFSNAQQLNEFCDSVKLNPNEIYVDGREFAKKINRALKTPDTQFPQIQPFNKDYMKRARDMGE